MTLFSAVALCFQKIFYPQSPKCHAGRGKMAARRYHKLFPGGSQVLQMVSREYENARSALQLERKPCPKLAAKISTRCYATSWLVHQDEKGRRGSPISMDSGQGPTTDVDTLARLRQMEIAGEQALDSWKNLDDWKEGATRVALEAIWTTNCMERQHEDEQHGIPTNIPGVWQSLLSKQGHPRCPHLDAILSQSDGTAIRNVFLSQRMTTHINALSMALASGELKGCGATETKRHLRKVVEDALNPPKTSSQYQTSRI